jgi:hypothetical protein
MLTANNSAMIILMHGKSLQFLFILILPAVFFIRCKQDPDSNRVCYTGVCVKFVFKNHLTCLFILLLSFFSCKKSTPSVTLPPITETGANSFGCKVNGKDWVPYWRCFNLVAGATELSYYIQPIYSTNSLPILISVTAGNSTDRESFFNFQQNSSYSDHIYGTGNIVDSVLINYVAGSGTVYTNYQIYPGQNSPRYLQISKLDTVNKILSGTFAFTLY